MNENLFYFLAYLAVSVLSLIASRELNNRNIQPLGFPFWIGHFVPIFNVVLLVVGGLSLIYGLLNAGKFTGKINQWYDGK